MVAIGKQLGLVDIAAFEFDSVVGVGVQRTRVDADCLAWSQQDHVALDHQVERQIDQLGVAHHQLGGHAGRMGRLGRRKQM